MHPEIVRDLTTDSLILALRRFCSRRGYPHIIPSDNGTKFVGAESELKAAPKGPDKKRIEEEVNDNQTKWLFNPPCSPWMSWAMEAMAKVTKRALKAVIRERTFTGDTPYTIMTEIESTVSSRPSTNVSDNNDEYETPTPNLFPLRRRSNNTPAINNKETDATLQRKWKAVQTATNMFGHDGPENDCQC